LRFELGRQRVAAPIFRSRRMHLRLSAGRRSAVALRNSAALRYNRGPFVQRNAAAQYIHPPHPPSSPRGSPHKAAEEQYHGCYRSLADYAQEITEETSEIPKHLEFYIDYDRMGRGMEISGDVFTIETAHDQVHIFWSH